jgi:hypothetical protein
MQSILLRKAHRLHVFENKLLWKIYERHQGGIRNNKELHDLYRSPCIVRAEKSIHLQYYGHAASMGRQEMHGKF